MNLFHSINLMKAYYNSRGIPFSIHQSTASCNAIIRCYLQDRKYKQIVQVFISMVSNHIEIDSYTCNFVLKACTASSDYETGMIVIGVAEEKGFHRNSFFGSSAVTFLTSFGRIEDARLLFDSIPLKDSVCWNSMISGYVQSGLFTAVFDLFYDMVCSRISPTPITLTCLVQAGEGVGSLVLGKCIHGNTIVLGMGGEVLVLTSLIGMYSKMGEIQTSIVVFESMSQRSTVSWNAMIHGYVKNRLIHESFRLFRRMFFNGVRFDSATLVSLVHGCSMEADSRRGKAVHGLILRNNFEANIMLSTSMVDLYSKCGELKQAYSIFEKTEDKNVVLWTAMIVGMVQNGHAVDAYKMFVKMREEGVAPNSFTLVGLIQSCSHLGLLNQGRSVHARLLRLHGFRLDAVKATSLIDMYSKCGKMTAAQTVFDCSENKDDVVLLNSVIMGHGIHGNGEEALRIYKTMESAKIDPNESTFLALLTACSHSGLVEEGVGIFYRMGVNPIEKHYAGLVDLLSRAGRLEEAEAVTKKLPFRAGSAILEALLSGCRSHRNSEVGLRTADRLLELGAVREQGLKKTGGYSSVEVGGGMELVPN